MRSVTAVVAAIASASLLTLDARQSASQQATPPAQTQTNPTAQTPQTAAPRRTEADARAAAERNRRERALQRQKTGVPAELISNYVKAQMLPVPASLGVDAFYTKYVDAQGIPVISSDKVPDDALLVARDIINSMLAKRPDLRAAMIKRKWRTGVIAEVEMTMDIPEYSRMKRPDAPRDEPVNQLDHERVGRNRGAELVDQVVLRLPGAVGTEQMIGDRVGLPALVAAVDDTLGDPAQILDQDDAQGDRRSPQFANRERLLLLIGVDEGAPGIDIEAAVGVRDERPDESEHPRQSGEGPVGELGQLAVISRR